MTMILDDTDRRIVTATQSGLPIGAQPYAAVAKSLDLTPDDVMRRMRRMQDSGVIRRIGAVPNHYRLGYRANGMSVWDVPDALASDIGRQVGALEFVTHCYQRPRHLPDWPFNLFAMVHAHTREEVEAHVDEIAALMGDACRGHDILFSTKILKKTGLRIAG